MLLQIEEKKSGNEVTGVDSLTDKVLTPTSTSDTLPVCSRVVDCIHTQLFMQNGNDLYEESVPDVDDFGGEMSANRTNTDVDDKPNDVRS